MADNVIADPGAGGATFATDEIGGVHYARSKVVWGPDGTANDTDDASGKRLPVKVSEALPAGTNNIGDVDVLTVPAPLSTTGGGTEATALRVTLANDSTGVVSVDDNGGSLTVDGTFWQATQPVSAATLPLPTGAATAALQTQPGVDIGDVTINNAAGASAVNVQDGGNSLTVDGTVAVSGTVAVTESGTWTVQPGNTPNTVPWLMGHGKTLKTVSGTLTADTDIVAAVTSKRVKVIAYALTGSGVNANTVLFKSNGTGGTELWRLLMQSSANIAAGANLSIAAPSFLFATAAGEKLTMDVNQTDPIHYSLTYFDDDLT